MDEEDTDLGLEASSVVNVDMENTVGYGLISEAEKLHQVSPFYLIFKVLSLMPLFLSSSFRSHPKKLTS